MTETLVITAVTVIAMTASIVKNAHLKLGKIRLDLYYIITLFGAVLLIALRQVPIDELFSALLKNTAVNPLKILVLFISMTVLSVFLDEAGFFHYIANLAVTRAGASQKKLFFLLYATVAFLTVFTSNDIIILTFTPFICYFCKNSKISPMPFLFAEFTAANTWSMLLIIGNPTNIYLATAAEIGFFEYILAMIIPTFFAGLVSLAALYLAFRKKLSAPMSCETDGFSIKDKPMAILGIIVLLSCTILLAVSSYVGFEMWYVSLAAAFILTLAVLVYSLKRRSSLLLLGATYKRAPYELIPFVLSMFVFVLAFERVGISAAIADLTKGANVIWLYGIASTAAANIMNNIPMSVLFSAICGGVSDISATYATIIGSNIGALLTPVGALAGIMWEKILRAHSVELTFGSFVKSGVFLATATLVAALVGLSLSSVFGLL